MLMLASCGQNANKTSLVSPPLGESNKVEAVPDTIKLPGGFYIGMTEEEIRRFIDHNPKVFFIKKDEPFRIIHTRINKEEYLVELTLYKGKLNSVNYMGTPKWGDVGDPALKAHYKAVYDLLKGLNGYYNIRDVYFMRFKVEWPYSIGYNEGVLLTTFNLTKEIIEKEISLSVNNYDGKISVDFNYSGEFNGGHEPTLSKSLKFQ